MINSLFRFLGGGAKRKDFSTVSHGAGSGGGVSFLSLQAKRRGTSPEELEARVRSWVAICARKNGRAVADTPLRLYRASAEGEGLRVRHRRVENAAEVGRVRKAAHRANHVRVKHVPDDDLVEILDHPILSLLSRPNPITSGEAGLDLTSQMLDISGRCYWYAPRDERLGIPLEYVHLLPSRVQQVRRPGEWVSNYLYRRPDGSEVLLDPDDVIAFRSSSPVDPHGDLGSLEVVADAADRFTEYDLYERALSENNARPDMVVRYTQGQLDAETRDDYEAEWRDRFGGFHQSGQPIVMDQDFEVVPVGWGPREMSHLDGRTWSLREIASGFDIPYGLLAQQDYNRANMEAAIWHWMRFGIGPRLCAVECALNHQLLSRYPDSNLFLAYDSPVPSDEDRRLSQEQSDLDRGVVTVNEVRNRRHLGDPVEWGDAPMKAAAPAPPPAAAGVEVEAPRDPAREGKGFKPPTPVKNYALQSEDYAELYDRIGTGEIALGDGVAELQTANAFPESVAKQFLTPVSTQIEQGHVGVLSGPQKAIVAAVKDFHEKYALWLLPSLRESVASSQPTAMLKQLEFDKIVTQVEDLAKDSVPAIRAIALAAGNQALQQAGIEFFWVRDSNIEKSVQAQAFKFANRYGEGFTEELRKLMLDWHDEGSRIPDLAAKIAEKMDVDLKTGKVLGSDKIKYRAERIARTEANRARVEGRIASYAATGVIEFKEWDSNGDSCPFCQQMHGKRMRLDEPYYKKGQAQSVMWDDPSKPEEAPVQLSVRHDYEDVMGPPLHPNCRCTLVPVVDVVAD